MSGQTLTVGAYVARARLDHARFERYGAAAASILEGMSPKDVTAAAFRLVFHDDVAAALRNLQDVSTSVAIVSIEMTMVLLFDHDVVVDAATVALLGERSDVRGPTFQGRLALASAAGAGPNALRDAVVDLEASGLHADAARGRGLLARITRDPADRRAAEEQLRALGDRVYLARLDEPFEPRSG